MWPWPPLTSTRHRPKVCPVMAVKASHAPAAFCGWLCWPWPWPRACCSCPSHPMCHRPRAWLHPQTPTRQRHPPWCCPQMRSRPQGTSLQMHPWPLAPARCQRPRPVVRASAQPAWCHPCPNRWPRPQRRRSALPKPLESGAKLATGGPVDCRTLDCFFKGVRSAQSLKPNPPRANQTMAPMSRAVCREIAPEASLGRPNGQPPVCWWVTCTKAWIHSGWSFKQGM
jgi:hypothetical protein